MQTFIVAIDGPAGVGKSTLAKMVAKEFNIPNLDTGAMYRTTAIKLGAEGVDLAEEKLEKHITTFNFSLSDSSSDAKLLCNGQDVSSLPIRSEKASRLASIFANFPIIRQVLQENQRKIAQNSSLVVEGRDMGTKVFPHAQYKIFLDANPEVRAKRRYEELLEKGEKPDFNVLFTSLQERDALDRTRKTDPLKPAPDAFIIDTSNKTLEEVFDEIKNYIKKDGYTMNNINSAKENASTSHEKLEFTHIDSKGNACMVNVGDKDATKRVAIVGCRVDISEETLALLKENALPKGDVLTTAKIAGILGAKQTSFLIPMCHPLSISYADIRFKVHTNPPYIDIESEVHTYDKTGVEMEAIIAAQVAAATIYDMCKAVQKDISINECRLLSKSGGKSDYKYTPMK